MIKHYSSKYSTDPKLSCLFSQLVNELPEIPTSNYKAGMSSISTPEVVFFLLKTTEMLMPTPCLLGHQSLPGPPSIWWYLCMLNTNLLNIGVFNVTTHVTESFSLLPDNYCFLLFMHSKFLISAFLIKSFGIYVSFYSLCYKFSSHFSSHNDLQILYHCVKKVMRETVG